LALQTQREQRRKDAPTLSPRFLSLSLSVEAAMQAEQRAVVAAVTPAALLLQATPWITLTVR